MIIQKFMILTFGLTWAWHKGMPVHWPLVIGFGLESKVQLDCMCQTGIPSAVFWAIRLHMQKRSGYPGQGWNRRKKVRLVDTSLLLDMLKVIKRSSITDRGAVPSRLNAMTAGMQTRMPCKSKSVSGKMDEKWMKMDVRLHWSGSCPDLSEASTLLHLGRLAG